MLESKDFWTTDEVKDLVKDKFDIDYCLNSIRKLLKKIGMNYNVPYCLDYREALKLKFQFKNLSIFSLFVDFLFSLIAMALKIVSNWLKIRIHMGETS